MMRAVAYRPYPSALNCLDMFHAGSLQVLRERFAYSILFDDDQVRLPARIHCSDSVLQLRKVNLSPKNIHQAGSWAAAKPSAASGVIPPFKVVATSQL